MGSVLKRFKVGKHFSLTIGEGTFSFVRKEKSIQREEALDGIAEVYFSTFEWYPLLVSLTIAFTFVRPASETRRLPVGYPYGTDQQSQ